MPGLSEWLSRCGGQCGREASGESARGASAQHSARGAASAFRHGLGGQPLCGHVARLREETAPGADARDKPGLVALAPELVDEREVERLADESRYAAIVRERLKIARELHVHPQTVRYRLARLREQFGATLEDPDARFELELALRSRPVSC